MGCIFSIGNYKIKDFPAIKRHLDEFYPELKKRADQGDSPYNLHNCAYMEDFNSQKIVWGNLNLTATYCIAEPGMYINAPCRMFVPGHFFLHQLTHKKSFYQYLHNIVSDLPFLLIKQQN
jgi:hypothetical protein